MLFFGEDFTLIAENDIIEKGKLVKAQKRENVYMRNDNTFLLNSQ